MIHLLLYRVFTMSVVMVLIFNYSFFVNITFICRFDFEMRLDVLPRKQYSST
jgi:hypothetical protein